MLVMFPPFIAYNGQSYETEFSIDRRILASHEDPSQAEHTINHSCILTTALLIMEVMPVWCAEME